MNALEAIERRKSVRAYSEEQIPEDALAAILKAGFAAPVASGQYDSLHITVVQDKDLLKAIANGVSELLSQLTGRWVDRDFGAPVMVLVSSKPALLPGIDYANAACVLENMVIAATSLGIDNILWAAGAAVIASDEQLMRELGIPEGFKPLLCASFGYAKVQEAAKTHEISVNHVALRMSAPEQEETAPWM